MASRPDTQPAGKILITGAGGFLGWNFSRLERNDTQWLALRHKGPVDGFANVIDADLTNELQVANILRTTRPNLILHLAANSDAGACQKQPAETRRVNVDAPRILAQLAEEIEADFVFASSDLVYDGRKGNYREEDPPAPVSVYGEQKLAAEMEIARACRRHYICRVPMMFGECHATSHSTFMQILAALRANKPLTLFTDEYRTMARGRSIAKGLLCLPGQPHGIYNFGGAERLSRHEFGLKICNVFGFEPQLIRHAKQADLQLAMPRPPDVSMCNHKALSIGFKPLAVDQELLSIKKLGV